MLYSVAPTLLIMTVFSYFLFRPVYSNYTYVQGAIWEEPDINSELLYNHIDSKIHVQVIDQVDSKWYKVRYFQIYGYAKLDSDNEISQRIGVLSSIYPQFFFNLLVLAVFLCGLILITGVIFSAYVNSKQRYVNLEYF